MIRIIEQKKETNPKTIPMSEMKPLQVGMIITDGLSCTGHYVMRTAHSFRREVMDISDPGTGMCWEDGDGIQVCLLGAGESIILEIFNEED